MPLWYLWIENLPCQGGRAHGLTRTYTELISEGVAGNKGERRRSIVYLRHVIDGSKIVVAYLLLAVGSVSR